MTRTELIQAVALRMDEITPSAGLSVTVDGSDNNPLYALIDGLIDSGVLELFSVAPYWRLPNTPFVYDEDDEENEIIVQPINNDQNSRKIIRLKVNASFLRVAEINCDDFQRPITEVFPEQSDMGKRQHNRFLMGKEAKPVGVISHDFWGDSMPVREIDCYSLAADTTVTEESGIAASYIAKPGEIASTGSSAVEDVLGGAVLIPALEWLLAARTFGARGDASHAEICQQNAQNLLV